MKPSLPFLLFGLLCLVSARAQDTATLRGHYDRAVAAAKEAYEAKVDDLLKRYGQHLDRLAAEAQAQGELEEVLALQAERKAAEARRAPGPGESDARVTALRRTLATHLAEHGQSLTNEWIRIEETYAGALQRQLAAGGEETAQALRASELRLRTLKGEPPPAEEEEEAAPADPGMELGENLLSHGDFDKAVDGTWSIDLTSRIRNHTGLFTEPLGDTGGARNRTMRLHRDRSQTVTVSRSLQIPHGVTEVSLSWRARLLKPERDDVAVRGTGQYSIVLGTSPARWTSLTAPQRATAVYESRKTVPPPSGLAWQTHEAILRVDTHINRIHILVPAGNGMWLVDDLSVRPVKPKPKP